MGLYTAWLAPQIANLDFRLTLAGQPVTSADCEISQPAVTTLEYRHVDFLATWRFTPSGAGWLTQLELTSDHPLACSAIELSIDYVPSVSIETLRLPTYHVTAEFDGMQPVPPIGGEAPLGVNLRGAFSDHRSPGLFLCGRGPQNFPLYFGVRRLNQDSLCFTAETTYPRGFTGATSLKTELVWLSTQLNLPKALETCNSHYPRRALTPPPVGWNSWDYYWNTVKLEDVIENMDFICADPLLSQYLRYIVVDDGWEHTYGDWYPNYRFPGGLERLAVEITTRGFIPGIWTTPVLIHPESFTALRRPELLIKNEYGDPFVTFRGNYMLDPSHPAGEAHLRETYTRLHLAGFRFFKIDFASPIVGAPGFHDPDLPPVEALRKIYRIIRESVGPESHILGCSLPAYCGPGLADSQRISMDIRNKWSHVEWVADALQLAYQQHAWMGVNDSDFLIVRGTDTSLELNMNVLDPKEHDPASRRWQSGPVFNLEEARTWATLVSLAGGNLFLGDRLNRLNAQGLELIQKILPPTGITAHPLDVGGAERPALWLQKLEGETRLGIINWDASEREFAINLRDWSIEPPNQVADFWGQKVIELQNGSLRITLGGHACAIYHWSHAI